MVVVVFSRVTFVLCHFGGYFFQNNNIFLSLLPKLKEVFHNLFTLNLIVLTAEAEVYFEKLKPFPEIPHTHRISMHQAELRFN